MSITCLNCSHVNHSDASYCDECGVKLPKVTSQDNSPLKTEASKEVAPAKFLNTPPFPVEYIEERIMSFLVTEEEVEETDFETITESKNPRPPIPVSTPTRLELPNEARPNFSPLHTILQAPQAALIDQETGQRFEIPSKQRSVYIGRVNPEYPVQIDLSKFRNADVISRIHAVIHNDDETYFLEDAGSTNGTWLNGEKLQPGARFRKQLKSGDRLGFGRNQSIKLTFELN